MAEVKRAILSVAVLAVALMLKLTVVNRLPLPGAGAPDLVLLAASASASASATARLELYPRDLSAERAVKISQAVTFLGDDGLREDEVVQRVVARIYDAKPAEVYERLGIPTIATVPWTTDRLFNALTRESETAKWRDPTGTVAVSEVVLHDDWVGHRATDLEQATGARVAFIIRFGTGILPEPKTVIQAGDQVYVAAISGRAAEAVAIAALPPGQDLESGART